MKFQVALWILIMEINFSLNKDGDYSLNLNSDQQLIKRNTYYICEIDLDCCLFHYWSISHLYQNVTATKLKTYSKKVKIYRKSGPRGAYHALVKNPPFIKKTPTFYNICHGVFQLEDLLEKQFLHKHPSPSSPNTLKPKQSGLCSTWGNFHFKTFDGKIYRFPGICNYLFATHCGKHFEDFNIQIQQSLVDNLPAISQISVKLNELLIEIIDHKPTIHDQQLELPYNKNGIRIEKTNAALKISAKLILDLTWNENNSIHLTLNKKYMGETCGLCGDYNSDPSTDISYNGNAIDPLLFGELQKLSKPEQQCEVPNPETGKICFIYRAMCLKQLRNYKWARCNRLVKPEPYIEAYMLDMCLCKDTEKYSSFCLCSTITEYSSQCALAGGSPPEWRSRGMCYKPCPANLIYKECSPPCAPTCSNPGRQFFCDGPCVAGCTCPKGYVMDDITNVGCILRKNCSCIYNNEIYPPGSVYDGPCYTCLCSGGHWNCEDLPCPSICSVEGGSHITTFDKAQYTFHGKCIYVLTKPCADDAFSVTIEMKKCAYSESATCLTRVLLFLDKGTYVLEIKYDNSDFPDVTFDKESMAKAGVSIFWPSSFYLIVHTSKGLYLQVQLMPAMQLYVVLDPSYKEKMCGLCGNFNSIQKDDFRTSSGALEINVADFANTWKTNYQCKNVIQVHEHPCIYGMEIEKYAHYWCNLLIDTEGPFASCHASVSPGVYHQNCLFDTCSCKRAEDCLCAVISSYVWACAAAGIKLSGWREVICRNFLSYCPPSFVYSYTVTTCIPTCRSLTEPDPTCSIKFYTVDGCVCPMGTYINDTGFCVKKEDCPCYYKGVPVSTNEPLHVGRLICTCTKGTIYCIDKGIQECPHPMIYFDCEKVGENAKGSQCLQTCHTSKTQCYSPLCVSGCLCPEGLLLSDNGTCIREEQCPCMHNGINYKPGEITTIHCDKCICRNRSWVCDRKAEKGICTLYGEGHYITFDNKRYTINGDCEYTLAQDYCDIDDLRNGTFKVISESIPCGTTGTSCSKAITVYVGAHKLILMDGHLEVVERSSDVEIPFKSRTMGLFIVIETKSGLVLVWDRMTSIFIHLSTNFMGKVCGLCGNFDGNSNNDFTTRSQCVVEDVKQFRDSWKVSPDCPEVYISKDPCVVNPYRMAWAQKLCNIIISHVFAPCHSEVDPDKYYEDCVKDTCSCDMGGDCECYCTAVSAYAQACSEACVCIEWRTPSVCPLFCDFYNEERQCKWHYKSCGALCMKTCKNPSGICLSHLKGLEGCYPICPEDKPYFNEDEMQCVAQCGCLDKEDNYYTLGERVESCNICESCICTIAGILCHYDPNACNCEYQGQLMEIGESFEVEEGPGSCIVVTCGLNGTVESPCYSTTETNIGPTGVLSKTTSHLVTISTSVKTSKIPTTSATKVSTKSKELSATSMAPIGTSQFSTTVHETIKISRTAMSSGKTQHLTASTGSSKPSTKTLTATTGSVKISTKFAPSQFSTETSSTTKSTLPTSYSKGTAPTATFKVSSKVTEFTELLAVPTRISKVSTTISKVTEVTKKSAEPTQVLSQTTKHLAMSTVPSTPSVTSKVSSTVVKQTPVPTTKMLETSTSHIETSKTLTATTGSVKISTKFAPSQFLTKTSSTTKPTLPTSYSKGTAPIATFKVSSKVSEFTELSAVPTRISEVSTTISKVTEVTKKSAEPTQVLSQTTKHLAMSTVPSTLLVTSKVSSTVVKHTPVSTTKMLETSTSHIETSKTLTATTGSVKISTKFAPSQYSTKTSSTTKPTLPTSYSKGTAPTATFKVSSKVSEFTEFSAVPTRISEVSTTISKVTEVTKKRTEPTQVLSQTTKHLAMSTVPSTILVTSKVSSTVVKHTPVSTTKMLETSTSHIETSKTLTATIGSVKISTKFAPSQYSTKTSSTTKPTLPISYSKGTTAPTETFKVSSKVSEFTEFSAVPTRMSTVSGGETQTSTIATSSAVTPSSTVPPPTSSRYSIRTTAPSITSSVSTTIKAFTKISTVTARISKASSTTKGIALSTTFGVTEMSASSRPLQEITTALESGKVPSTIEGVSKVSSSPAESVSVSHVSSFPSSTNTSTRGPLQVSETLKVSSNLVGTSEESFISMNTYMPESTIIKQPIITGSDNGIKPVPTTTESPEKLISSTSPASTEFNNKTTLPITETRTQVLVKTFYYSKCVNVTCHENATLDVAEVQCPTVENVTCDSGIPPLKTFDHDGCCFHYECTYCVGPNGIHKNPGETWIDNCQDCACDKDLVKVSCSPIKCPPLDFQMCDNPWQKAYSLLTEEDYCCPQIECRCEPSQCQYLTETCPLGYESVPSITEGVCCVTFFCIPMNVCIVDGTVYQTGQIIWGDRSSCKMCRCSEIKDFDTGFNTVVCEPILCKIHCPQGSVYEKSDNDCCGKCVQVSCTVTAADGSLYLLEPGESQFLLDDNCTQYTCALIGQNLVTSSWTQICPKLHDEECDSGELLKAPDGCCNICQAPKTCRVQTNVTEISQNNCYANVTLSYCEGSCPSLTKFSDKSFQMEGKCGCCQEMETTKMEIELVCPGDKSNIKVFITSAKNCACMIVNCIP